MLTNADLDHTAGLLLLREGGPLHLHASTSVREYLSDPLAFTGLLSAFCGVVWHELPVNRWASLLLRDGSTSGLAYRAIPLRSPPPIFDRAGSAAGEEQTTAFLIRDEQTGGMLLAAPDVFEVNASLESAVRDSHAILFDGTFWSEHELITIKPVARKASAMGHLPISNGSLDLLSRSRAPNRIYVHINNSNPILLPGSDERKAVEDAGIAVGMDGMDFTL